MNFRLLSGQEKWRRLARGRFGFIALYIDVREIFCQGGGGAVNHLPKKFSQVARIFPKRTVEKKRGPYDATTGAALAYEGGSIL